MSNGILNYRGMRVSRDEGTPQVIIHFMLVFHCKESILGYQNSRGTPSCHQFYVGFPL